ncbi:hypothetical protein B9G55_15690 [Saccharibacillus sp. O16]|nr:hypothetical protein B9G55_15690 [Saccharibacillus sp. O16]
MKRKMRRLLKEAYGRLFGQGTEKRNRRAGMAAHRIYELHRRSNSIESGSQRTLNEEWAMDARRLLF